ncbi:hypothetical protein NIB75_12270 [Bacteroides uniformis]|nr:hypothetical protein [Bacteroides uniformis]
MRWNVLCVETEKKEDWISRKSNGIVSRRSLCAGCLCRHRTDKGKHK